MENRGNSGASIRRAKLSDLSIVKSILEIAISEVYPHYYPKGAVDFFLIHHSEENISNDIKQGRVFLYFNLLKNAIGTVTIKENEICRLFVLPSQQGKGYVGEILDFSEAMIFKNHEKVVLDASLPAKSIYLKRGYRETGFYSIRTEQGDFLCYDVMEKCRGQIKTQ